MRLALPYLLTLVVNHRQSVDIFGRNYTALISITDQIERPISGTNHQSHALIGIPVCLLIGLVTVR